MTEGHYTYKKSLNIDSTMLEVVNAHWLIWIILIYKCKLYQPMNEQKHWKRAVIIFMPTSIFVIIGHSPIYSSDLSCQCCSLANAATQKEAFAKEQCWDVSIDTKCFI